MAANTKSLKTFAMKFMQHALVGALSFVSVLALAAEPKAGSDSAKYSIVPDFFEKNPGGQSLGPVHGGTAIDKAGNIYVSTDTPRGIVVFTKDGKYSRHFGPSHIHGMELKEENGKEFIYAALHTNNKAVKMDLEGKTIWEIKAPMESKIFKDEKGFKPCAVTAAPDGSVFVADGYGSNYVLKFDKNQKFVKAFGGPGAEEGKFNTCHGIGIDTRGEKPLVLVCNRNNNRVEHWDLDGNFVKVIQKDLRMPAAVQFQGKYAVFPELQGRVTLIDDKGKMVHLGDNPNTSQRANFGLAPEHWKEGICNSPHGASMDKNQNVIVSEWSQFGHMHKFKKGE